MSNELLSGIENLESMIEGLLEDHVDLVDVDFLGIPILRTSIITFPEEGRQYYNSDENLLPRTDIFKSLEDAQLFLSILEDLNWGYSQWDLVNMSWNNHDRTKTVAAVHWNASSIGRTSVYNHEVGDVPIMEVRNGRMIVYD